MVRLIVDLPLDLPEAKVWILLDKGRPPQGPVVVQIRDAVGSYARTAQAELQALTPGPVRQGTRSVP